MIKKNCFQEKDLEAGNVENDRPSKSKLLVLGVVNHSVYSMWALVYVVLMSLLITVMMLYGEHIYRAIGNSFVEEVKLKIDQIGIIFKQFTISVKSLLF